MKRSNVTSALWLLGYLATVCLWLAGFGCVFLADPFGGSGDIPGVCILVYLVALACTIVLIVTRSAALRDDWPN